VGLESFWCPRSWANFTQLGAVTLLVSIQGSSSRFARSKKKELHSHLLLKSHSHLLKGRPRLMARPLQRLQPEQLLTRHAHLLTLLLAALPAAAL